MWFPYNFKILLRLIQLKLLSVHELLFTRRISERPEVHCINTDANTAIKKAVDATGEFIPSIWAPGPYSQMLFSFLFHRAKHPYTRREEVVL